MTIDELITQTSQQNNVTEEEIRLALPLLNKWKQEEYIEALGILGNVGVHGTTARLELYLLSNRLEHHELKQADVKNVGYRSARALVALQQELYGVVNI